MIYKPENVKLVITHDGIEQEVIGITDYPINFDESTCSDECSVVSGEQIECVFQRVSKTKEKSKKSKPTTSCSTPSCVITNLTFSDLYIILKYPLN